MDVIKVGLAQIAPVWLQKQKTLEKIVTYLDKAAGAGCELVVFGEALLPGYPFWLSLTGGASFDSRVQKELHAHYMRQAIQLGAGDLEEVRALARAHQMAIYLGTVERAEDRGGHSLYCSLVYIDPRGQIRSVHRKLQPTYEERLTWSPGDGHGLVVHRLKEFHVGGLNCWENWMPLVRTALYGMGENLHIAVWPGSDYNTRDITRFIARESRSFVISVSGFLTADDIPLDTPHYQMIVDQAPPILANGGSCVAGPDGEWIIPPQVGDEALITVSLDFRRVFEERQNFDPVGHYARPDVTRLTVVRDRQSVVDIRDTDAR